MSSLAQEEADRLLNPKEHISSHPEDRLDFDNDDDDDARSSSEQVHEKEEIDDEYDDDLDDTADKLVNNAMFSRATRSGARNAYQIPSTSFDANTGPKGVISDAQAYERAKRNLNRRTFGQEFGQLKNRFITEKQRTSPPPTLRSSDGSSGTEDEDDEDAFMRRWREARMQELQQLAQRKPSPGRTKKRWGRMENVGASGYLDAVEQTPGDTMVVVCIYDPESTESSIVEDCLATLARKQDTTRFVKLHHEIAEMDHITAPALIAYKGGDVFTTIIDIFRQLPSGRACSSASLEDLLMAHRIL